MEKINEQKIRVDYHFHPNLPITKKRAEKKIRKIYSKLDELNINVVLITEHVYKNYVRAWDLMKKNKPENFFIFPGLEYVTKENIDICLFSETENIYKYHIKPFQMSYEEVLSFLEVHKDVFGYVTHPFTLGETSILDKKGEKFTKIAIEKLGSVEAAYTEYHRLKELLQNRFIKSFFTKTLRRIEENEKMPKEFYPSNIKFLATGSDAHHVWEIGTCVEVALKENNVFHSVINNKEIHRVGKRKSNVPQLSVSLLTTLREWWMKKFFKIWNYY